VASGVDLALSPDSVISILFVNPYPFLNGAELRQRKIKGSGIEKELLPTQMTMTMRHARYAASEKEVEGNA